MNRLFPLLALGTAVGLLAQTPPPTADPYANNAEAGKLQFPLASPAGKDSGAITKALPGGVNQGLVDPATWKYGPAFDPRTAPAPDLTTPATERPEGGLGLHLVRQLSTLEYSHQNGENRMTFFVTRTDSRA